MLHTFAPALALLLPTVLAPVDDEAPSSAAPLRVTIRAGVKTHGPGQHDHPRFLEEWSKLLADRGADVQGAMEFPSAAMLDATDVLVMYAAEGASIHGEERERFDAYLARGGGLVVLHDAVCGDDPQWFETKAGGAWEHGHSKWLEGEVGLYFTGEDHPITRGVANFDFVDEIYYDLHIAPNAKVLANGFHSVFEVTPQMWVVDDGPYRAFVSIQGHEWTSFSHPAWRTLLLRGIAWAGHRDVELLTAPEEVRACRYPPGGPLPPEKAHEPFVLKDDFEISLVAAEPIVVNPISIDWDHRGRTWVAVTPSYPYKKEFDGDGNDRIVILGDQNGDGRMDHAKTFAGGLDLVTSFVFHQDGVIVTAAPDILFLRDTDGDDVADVREVLYTGFGYGDTHAVTSNMRWGLDGWIYACQGYSGNASRDIRNANGDGFGHVPNGVFRFQPDGSAIEPYSVYGSNTWGLDFAPDGELFFTMANGSHLRHVVAREDALGPDRIRGTRSWQDIVDHREANRISRADREPYVQIDFVGGFTAAAGCTIYSGGAWPEEYAFNHFVCEPTINLVHRDLVRPTGATYLASKPRREEFLASTDPWFRPVQARTGPDGALYVLDFYNQAAVHNDTRGPKHGPTNAAVRADRDKVHGRIWRVQHVDAHAIAEGANFAREVADLRRALDTNEVPAHASFSGDPAERVRALWWHRLAQGKDVTTLLAAAFADEDAGVRRNAARIAGELAPDTMLPETRASHRAFLVQLVRDPSPRVRLEALDALRSFALEDAQVDELVAAYAALSTDWERSAFQRTAEADLDAFARAAIDADEALLVEGLASRIARRAEAASVVALLAELADADAPSLATALRRVQADLPRELALPSTEQGLAAMAKLLEHEGERVDVAIAALPLADRFAASEALAAEVEHAAERLLATVEDPDAELDARLASLTTLLDVDAWRARAITAAARFLDPYFPLETQLVVIERLGRTEDEAAADVLRAAFPAISHEAREAAFKEMIARPTWSTRMLDSLEAGDVTTADLGPHRVFRLRHHADPAVAERATALLDALGGGVAKEMDALIAGLAPQLATGGDAVSGKELFTKNCAVCHSFDRLDEGVGAHVGPELNGMGAHGREHLLPFIIDPNRSVEAAYLEYVAETVAGKIVAGVLTFDGKDSITLSSSDGDTSVRRDEIETLRSTGRSPMPTGFEDLGVDALRDILAFLCDGYEDFRIVDVSFLCNASTSKGLYDRQRDDKPIRWTATGILDVYGVPMKLIDPDRALDDNNAIVLKGGAVDDWESKAKMPQSVEVPVGYALQRMHVLGGIAAWGHPYFGQNEPIVEWTWNYADGSKETVVLHDGDQFADWIWKHDVPGSRYVEGAVAENSYGQVRTFHVDPSKTDVAVESITLKSFDNRMAPTFLGLTAQLGGVDPSEAAAEAAEPELTHPEVLVVGGGSSHDFARWYDAAMLANLRELDDLADADVEYTSRPADVLPRLETLDVLVISNNQPMVGEELRQGVFDFVARGGGLLILHPGAWYNWADWPEYNARLVGGGSRSHEQYQPFDVRVDLPDHPIWEGVPATFEIADELYRLEHDPNGSPVEVVATGVSKETGASYPVAWSVDAGDGAGRVLVITLGHDGGAHELPAFQRLIRNAVAWLRRIDSKGREER